MKNTVERLADLLIDPRETLDIEIKGWLDLSTNEHKAVLAKALVALANHGGGHVIIGFKEENAIYTPDDQRPLNLAAYSQDTVNGIVSRYADPDFHCDVHIVNQPGTEDQFPVIRVPGGHRVPIRSKRGSPDNQRMSANNYYIRRPGPKSETPQSAQEWDALIRRCVNSAKECH